ncbi:MAG: carboxymuconolactone decarboxylase family protein [Pseudomonadota bacterium]
MPNTPIARVARDDLPEAMQAAWDRSQAVRGDATLIETLGNAPELFDWYGDFYERLFYGGRVPAALKELARYKLSTTHGCRHCNLGNRRDALARGVSEAKLDAIDDPDADVFSDAERELLKLAGELSLVRPDGQLETGAYRRLRRYFDDAELMEIGMTLAVLVGMAKFLFVYDLVERETSCPFPQHQI